MVGCLKAAYQALSGATSHRLLLVLSLLMQLPPSMRSHIPAFMWTTKGSAQLIIRLIG